MAPCLKAAISKPATAAGNSPTAIARHLAGRFGIGAALLPASDSPVRTKVNTVEYGELPFQRYFVEHQCAPTVTGFNFQGAAAAAVPEAVQSALDSPTLEAIVICPSNPFISIDPILAVPGMREALDTANAPVVAVSPLIGGQAVKGPTAKMMRELGIPGTNQALSDHYAGLVDGWVIDEADATDAAQLSAQVSTAATLMTDERSRMTLAAHCLRFAETLR